jgi:FKBP-type peptidyl-prolyl cis-trans isomerase FkpA
MLLEFDINLIHYLVRSFSLRLQRSAVAKKVDEAGPSGAAGRIVLRHKSIRRRSSLAPSNKSLPPDDLLLWWRRFAVANLFAFRFGDQTTALSAKGIDMRATHPPATLLLALAMFILCLGDSLSAAQRGPVDVDAPNAFTKTDSGLAYRIRRRSTGRRPGPRDTVTVHYKGWLDDGKVFDNSYDRGEPTTFQLNRVVKGWTEGMQQIGEGGMIELEVPPELGYGNRGAGDSIPPGAQLHFLVELIKVE